ncbi:unnamed protein product [Rotaria magnacalcarata]|uniref:IRS-type PTB domain-containing protein n=1 Tax=Rotaria magnacalcarata TaxID=392030 RepID=A0A819T8P3_9BILA|nr:unnamed protein product [Rotaria magnacalcarata]CAF1459579.1 unnamed protein product [Rotaria magnacalcarata]CAF1921627.1 unnamed protein product [Rotaria magnacalcarata]CAF2098470.1 unnamed protein product [Rotaria magnacalcarata]CAF2112484.1 unnamed protein product [Rotaria magnacalcarata]
MGNNNSTTDLIDTSIINHEDIFKVDNINSHGRKHSSAKIQLSNDNLCIHQKHRQSLFIPLNTIKRYGLDGSIFILECGRRAPLGPARYAFHCKRAQHLANCLDQRISFISSQLFDEEHDELSLSLTTVSSNINRLRRTQSSLSLSSSTSFYRESQANLSENYFNFRKENEDYNNSLEINYTEFRKDTQKSNGTLSNGQSDEESAPAPALASNESKSYVFIDHEKTTTLKEIAEQRLQQNLQRYEV